METTQPDPEREQTNGGERPMWSTPESLEHTITNLREKLDGVKTMPSGAEKDKASMDLYDEINEEERDLLSEDDALASLEVDQPDSADRYNQSRIRVNQAISELRALSDEALSQYETHKEE